MIHEVETKITTEITTTIKLTGKDIIELLNRNERFSAPIQGLISVTFTVPSGADWSGIAVEIDKDYHKDNSFKIIPIALSDYFTKGVSIEETICNHTNIYDFCGRQKFKGQDYGTTSSIVGDRIVINKEQKEEEVIIIKA